MEEGTEQKTAETKKVSRRHLNRVAAMQFLYLFESNREENLNDLVLSFFDHQEKDREYYAFGEELIQGTIENLPEIDEKIQSTANNWTLDRIARVDLAILRVACFELLHRPDVPPVVSINEAIDLGKEYSNEESRRFLNGILDRMSKELHRPLRDAE
ncbi:MAG: transcription antitermination factor NusB [Verrucomicrobiota bacterium]